MPSLPRFAIPLALLAPAAPLAAQVGYPPERSPYRDLEFRQELTTLVGYYAASKDPAGVAPQGGPLLGLRYEVRVGGPAYFTARLAHVFSERTVLDPAQPATTRNLGTRSWPLVLSDAGLTINLTGQKSFHSIVPVLNGAVGLVSDFKGDGDVGGYKFGTSFAFSFGGGVRWVPGGRLQLRADVTDYLYSIKYPASYFTNASDSTAVLSRRTQRDNWKHNAALTIGASYLFFR